MSEAWEPESTTEVSPMGKRIAVLEAEVERLRRLLGADEAEPPGGET